MKQIHFCLLIKIKFLIRKILPNRQNYSYAKVTLSFLCVINFVLGVVLNYWETNYLLCLYPRTFLTPRFPPVGHFLLLPMPVVCRGGGAETGEQVLKANTQKKERKNSNSSILIFN